MKTLKRVILSDDEKEVIGKALDLRVHLPDETLARLKDHCELLDLKERNGPGAFGVTARDIAASEQAKISTEAGYGTKVLKAARSFIEELRKHYEAVHAHPENFGAPGSTWDATRKQDAERMLERYVLPAKAHIDAALARF